MAALQRCDSRLRAARRLALALLLPLLWPGTPAAAPRVVTSIAPVNALASAIMGDLGEPRQIVRGYGSPHAYQMRPSDAASLRDADLVLWIGPSLETFLQRPLEARGTATRVVELSALPGLRLLPNRSGGLLFPEEHAHGHDAHAGFDAHIWLSPFNAKRMGAAIAAELATLDPENGGTYRHNAEQLGQRIDFMQADIAKRLAPVRDTPFVVFHDAFQYFEEAFGLNSVGSVTVSPDRMPSAKRIKELKKAIHESGVRCVFGEPRFEPALMRMLIEDSNIRSGVLDPLGSEIPPGPEAYFQMMDANTNALIECLLP